MNKTFSLKKALAVALLLLLAAALAFVYVQFSEQTVAGSKAVTITVVNSAAQETRYSLKTDALYLIEAMNECDGLTYEASEGPYGLVIEAVNGERAVYSESGAYWGFSVNDQYCNYGVSEQPVEDGDAFVIAYTR